MGETDDWERILKKYRPRATNSVKYIRFWLTGYDALFAHREPLVRVGAQEDGPGPLEVAGGLQQLDVAQVEVKADDDAANLGVEALGNRLGNVQAPFGGGRVRL